MSSALLGGRPRHKRSGKRWFLILAVLFLVLWDPAWKLAGVQQMFPWDLQELLHENPDAVYLADARTTLEYEWFHIPGAVNLPDLLLDAELPPEAEGKTVIVICMTGHRSPVAAYRLERQKGVYNLTWGMTGWVLTGGGTVPGDSRRE